MFRINGICEECGKEVFWRSYSHQIYPAQGPFLLSDMNMAVPPIHWCMKVCPPAPLPDKREWGITLIKFYGSVKEAIKATHPDHGGDAEAFKAVMLVREAKEKPPTQ